MTFEAGQKGQEEGVGIKVAVAYTKQGATLLACAVEAYIKVVF